LAQLQGDYFDLWRSYRDIMLAFGAIIVTLFLSLAQLLGDYFGHWRSYREIMLAFGALTVKSC